MTLFIVHTRPSERPVAVELPARRESQLLLDPDKPLSTDPEAAAPSAAASPTAAAAQNRSGNLRVLRAYLLLHYM